MLSGSQSLHLGIDPIKTVSNAQAKKPAFLDPKTPVNGGNRQETFESLGAPAARPSFGSVRVPGAEGCLHIRQKYVFHLCGEKRLRHI